MLMSLAVPLLLPSPPPPPPPAPVLALASRLALSPRLISRLALSPTLVLLVRVLWLRLRVGVLEVSKGLRRAATLFPAHGERGRIGDRGERGRGVRYKDGSNGRGIGERGGDRG